MVEHIDVHVNDGMTTQEIAAVDDAREALNQLRKRGIIGNVSGMLLKSAGNFVFA